MTRFQSILVLFAAAALAGCSNQTSEPNPPAAGGSSGSGSGGSHAGGSGGSPMASGGASATGGSPGSGGSTVTSSGGTVGSGGQGAGGIGRGGSAAGGASGGAVTGGQGGTSQAGGATGSGAGGATGLGGAGGAAPMGGATGSGGSGTGGATRAGGATGSGGGPASGGAPGGRSGAGGATGSGGSGAGGATGSGGSTSTGTQHWVGTWSASPYYDSGNQPPSSLSNSVLRQVTHVSLGGSQIRVQFSNLGGNGSVTISGAHVALCKATSTVDSTIDTSTDKALAFSGTASVTIAQGKEVWSDPIDFTVPNQGNVTITSSFGTVPSQVVGHSGSRTTSYLAAGSTALNAASMTSATTFQHWYYISGIDVMADASAKAVVAIGDSITDGRGTDNDKNNRWTDIMAARVQANGPTANVGTLNQGIGATNLVGTSGTAAQARFNRDVLGQSGVKYVIVLDGVNDIGGGASFDSLKSAYDDLISRAHAKGLLIYGATILPFGGNTGSGGYYSAAHESVRQQVNTYIKSGVFDGVIDFDAALTDGGNPPKLQATYAAWTPNNPQGSADGLHPGPAGYQKMGDTVDLTLFTK